MKEALTVPEGITVKLEKEVISVAGKLGELKRRFSEPGIDIELKDNTLTFSSKVETRKKKRMINTFISEIENMFKGVTKGYKYTMKAVFTHFPMTLKVEGQKVKIENFIGERAPRYAKVFPGVDIKISKQDVELKGIDKYAVSQSAANIEQACRVGNRDRRVFQDGVYITKKDAEE